MRSVSVKELQNDLRRYLDEARGGAEVLIKERNKPVVKLVPLNASGHADAQPTKPAPPKPRSKLTSKRSAPKKERDYLTLKELEAHEAKLVAEGRMTLGKGPVPPDFFDEPLAEISINSLVPYVSEDRDED